MEQQIANINQQILAKLAKLQADIAYVKEYMEDSILTRDDLWAIEEAEEDFKKRRTISHERLKKELGL